MKYTIIKRFKDVETGAVFNIGEDIEISNPKRYQGLKESGCIQGEEPIAEPKKRGRKKK